jgi:hypothetical protein
LSSASSFQKATVSATIRGVVLAMARRLVVAVFNFDSLGGELSQR